MNDELTCPFCQEHGFDAVGLKHHLTSGHCEPFNATEGIERIPHSVVKPTEGRT